MSTYPPLGCLSPTRCIDALVSTWAIGDLQGCADEFGALLATIGFAPDRDVLWLAGDLLNRGPGSLTVLEQVRELGESCRVVLGNHDLHFLAVFYGNHDVRGSDTLDELLGSDRVAELADWLSQQPLVQHDARLGWLMVHAGVPPDWTLAELLSRAEEARGYYSGARRKRFFQHMYGNTPNCWVDGLAGLERVRCIVNYLTRMRLVAADGTLDFAHKGAPVGLPDGFLPWFERSRSAPLGANVAFGHWAALNGVTGVTDCAALDTGCVWGRELTALCLESGERVAVAAQSAKDKHHE